MCFRNIPCLPSIRRDPIKTYCKVLFLALAGLLLTGCGGGGSGGSGEGPPDPPIVVDDINGSFDASRRIINEGESTLLRWSITNATSVEITPDIGAAGLSGEREISPTESTTYTLSSYDNESIIGQQSLDITVRPYADIEITANTLEGPSPLTVRFTPLVQSATAINRYYWDFEGDGGDIDGGSGIGDEGFDAVLIENRLIAFDVVGRDVSHTFITPGVYQTRARVWDAEGNQRETSFEVTVTNAGPQISTSSDSNRGQIPLRVAFDLSARDDDGITQINWDFDNDGVVDREVSYSSVNYRSNEYYTYDIAGQFQPTITLIDSFGESHQFQPDHLKVEAVETPIQKFTVTVYNRVGPGPLSVNHQISTSAFSGDVIETYEWDFDGDGNVDLSGPERTVDHIYTHTGTTIGSVTAVTVEGNRTSNFFEVYVTNEFQLDISENSINPHSNETEITVSATADTEFEAIIVDAADNSIKTILPKLFRDAGEYNITWDGKDESGSFAAPGDYYVIIKSTIDGQEDYFDQRLTTGGQLFYPSGWGGSNSCSGSFTRECGLLTVSENPLEPYNKNPITFDISTQFNSRMSAYITLIGSEDYAATTFFRSKVIAGGDTSLQWYGTEADGQFVPFRTSRGYLPAIYGVTLSDNSIVLNHRTELTDVSIIPDVLDPSSRQQSNSESTIEFDLSRKADVTLSVDNSAHGVNVYLEEFRDIPAGADRQLTWDGRDNLGNLVGPGGYVITLIARDTFGQQTIPRKVIQRVEY